MELNGVVKREHKRCYIHKHINYAYNSDSVYGDSRVFMGITIDSSPAGMCLYVYRPLSVGDRLKISHDMYSDPQQHAVVRWIQKIDSDVFKAGLMFCSES